MPNGPSFIAFLSTVASAALAAVLLTGCVTSRPVAEQLAEGVAAPETEAEIVPVADGAASAAPPQHPSVGAVPAMTADAPSSPAAGMEASPAPPGSVVMQGTGLKATSSSIFSTGGAMAGGSPVSGGGMPASLFRSSPAQVAPLPPAGLDAGYQVQGAADMPATATRPQTAAMLTPPDRSDAAGPSEQSLSLIGLFAAGRKGRGKASAAPSGKAGKAPKFSEIAAGMPPQQVAALTYAPLPGIGARSMFATVDDTAADHDDSSEAVQVAALPGLARLSPSGLWLQTETVETGCFKPQLMRILTSVEAHFGRKVLVTSGRRDINHNIRVGGRPQSRHLTCEAADIQVPGVSKWDLATFLRQANGRGGVGTYCHTESVHIDIGPRRDWNWQCRPRDA